MLMKLEKKVAAQLNTKCLVGDFETHSMPRFDSCCDCVETIIEDCNPSVMSPLAPSLFVIGTRK